MDNSLEIKIDYDDDVLDIIDKVNEVLAKVGMVLQYDNREHDGFDIYSLVKLS